MGLSLLSLEFEDKLPSFCEVVSLVKEVTGLELEFDKHRNVAFSQFPNEKVSVSYKDHTVIITYVMGQFPVLGYILAKAFAELGGKHQRSEGLDVLDEYWRDIPSNELRSLHRKNSKEIGKLISPIYLVFLGGVILLGYVFYNLVEFIL